MEAIEIEMLRAIARHSGYHEVNVPDEEGIYVVKRLVTDGFYRNHEVVQFNPLRSLPQAQELAFAHRVSIEWRLTSNPEEHELVASLTKGWHGCRNSYSASYPLWCAHEGMVYCRAVCEAINWRATVSNPKNLIP